MSVILIILAEFLFVGLLILLFYRLKPWLGLVPLFVLIGSNQYFQTVLATSFQITLFGEYAVSPGSIILFSASLYTILLIYIKEGTAITQRLIFAIVLTNIAFTALSYISFQQQNLAQTIISSPGISPDFFKVNYRVFFVGSAALILDAFIIVILYEFFYTRLKWLNLFFRLLATMLIVLNTDAVIFILGSFWGNENIDVMLTSQLIGKSFSALFFTTLLFLYLRYFDKDKNPLQLLGLKGNEDIFSILTYQGKLEKLKLEKAISDEYLQKIIAEKTAEQEKSLRRHAIMASVKDLRIDKFSTAEQANEFLVKIKDAFDVDACSIHLIEDENLQILASIGITETGKDLKMDLIFPYLKEMIKTNKTLYIEDTNKDSVFKQEFLKGNNLFQYRSCAGAPMVSGKKIIGLVKLYSVERIHSFTKIELEHLQLVANQIAHAIEANQLFSQNEKHKEVLVKQIIARKKVEEEILKSEAQARILFNHSAVLIWEEDFSAVKIYTDQLKMNGVKDLDTFFINNSEELRKVAGLVKILSINQKSKEFYRVDSKDELVQNLPDWFIPESWETFRKEIVSLANGNVFFEGEIPIRNPQGEIKYLYVSTSVPPGFTESLDKVIVSFVDITEKKKAEEEIARYNIQLRQLTAHLQNIREEERSRIGREIHDELGQQLTAIKMDASWIDKNTPAESVLKKEKLRNILELLDGSNTAVRRILSELKPSILDEYGMLDTLDWLARQFTANTGIPVEISCSQNEIKLPENIATCIYRVFQESLTNITRYANAKKVISLISLSDTQISVTITDDGIGFDVSRISEKGSFGLLGMQERVNALNGRLIVDSKINKGTSITMQIPL